MRAVEAASARIAAAGGRSANRSISEAPRARISAALQSRRACGHRHRNQIAERLAQISPVRGLRMARLRLECVCDNAELVSNRRLIDYFHRIAAGLVQSGAGAFARTHPGAEIEHQRMDAAVTGRARPHHVQSRDRQRQRSQRRHLEPEQRVDPHVTDARNRRGRFVEQHQARHFDRRTRARAQINQHQQREAESIDEVLRIEETHDYLTIPSSGSSRSIKLSRLPAPNACA